jgi:hypothetical protein
MSDDFYSDTSARAREVDRREHERNVPWSSRIQIIPTPNANALCSIVESMRRFGQDRRQNKIWHEEYQRLLMDLVCEAITCGAFSGMEWLQFRTRLANNPSFGNAVKFLGEYRPAIWPQIGGGTSAMDIDTHIFSCHIERFANQMSPPPTPTIPAVPVPLSKPNELPVPDRVMPDHQEEILQALFELKAFDKNSRKSTETIAKTAIGKENNPDVLKRPISALKKLGYVATKGGKGGGVWLTPFGKVKAIEIAER